MSPLTETSRKSGTSHKSGSTGRLISSYYLEIDYLLQRVSGSLTHYQALGLDYSATNKEIVSAYHDAVRMLHNPNRKVWSALPEEMQQSIDVAFNRTSEAFLVLTDPVQRTEYDRSIGRKSAAGTQDRSSECAASDDPESSVDILQTNPNRVAAVESSDARDTKENRRRAGRIKIALTTHVTGYDRSGQQWKEMTKTIDVSRTGTAITLNRRVKHGVVLHLRLPMPERLRCHGYGDPAYNAYAIVRRVELPANGTRIVGLEFIGEAAPPGYLDKPWTAYRSRKWTGCDRRREPREKRSEPVVVEYLDLSMNPIGSGKAVTEDVSQSGLRLIVKSPPADFELVRVSNRDNSVRSLAEVRNQFVDDDGRERLCLRLIDCKWRV